MLQVSVMGEKTEIAMTSLDRSVTMDLLQSLGSAKFFMQVQV
ncbi:MAG: hypothetical protein AAF329_20395 [Cyanobacteria bacterium P01_A01_bin.17]